MSDLFVNISFINVIFNSVLYVWSVVVYLTSQLEFIECMWSPGLYTGCWSPLTESSLKNISNKTMENTPVSEMFVTLDSGINDSYSLDPSVSQTDNSGVWIFTIMTMVVIFAIVSGNTLVCIAVATDRSLKAVQNRFLVSLAIADLAVGIVIMPMGLVNQLLGYWMFGVVLCQLWKVCDVLACTASIWNLCLIAIDRYCSITRAVKYTAWRTSHRVNMMIVFVWALAIFISVPPLFGWRVEDSPSGRFKCLISEDVAYILFSTMGSFYIPAVIMIVTYAKVWRAAKVRARSNSNVRDYEIKNMDNKPFSTDSNCHSQNYGNTGKSLSEETSKKVKWISRTPIKTINSHHICQITMKIR